MTLARAARGKTALHRNALSQPVSLALQDGLISEQTTFFDYGCGRGGDVQRLDRMGLTASGWDPVHAPDGDKAAADVVNLGYVVNVIEDTGERTSVLRDAWGLTRAVLIVSARLIWELRQTRGLKPLGDGFVTSRGTFQKPFTQEELRAWIEGVTGVTPLAAAPGVYYVFKDPRDANAFLATRYKYRAVRSRTPVSATLFEEHRELLEGLSNFVDERGRLPRPEELTTTPRIVEELGSLRRAFAIIRQVTGKERWQQRRRERTEDLRVYLALGRFGGRPKLSELPLDIQYDVKDFYGTYKAANADADELLFSAGSSEVIDEACRGAPGKLTHEALYIHTSALDALPPLLRVYEGCARALSGAVEDATVLKLHRHKAQVSYLSYPRFERDPHPALSTVVVSRLWKLEIDFKDFRESENPPILHRKEAFLLDDHPLRDRFARLTRQEERYGLFANPRLIGTQDGWRRQLEIAGVRLKGHRLVTAE